MTVISIMQESILCTTTKKRSFPNDRNLVVRADDGTPATHPTTTTRARAFRKEPPVALRCWPMSMSFCLSLGSPVVVGYVHSADRGECKCLSLSFSRFHPMMDLLPSSFCGKDAAANVFVFARYFWHRFGLLANEREEEGVKELRRHHLVSPRPQCPHKI